MKYLLMSLFFFAAYAHAQVGATTNSVSTNAVKLTQYTRLNLRDKASWGSFFSNQRASNASMWQTWWSARWGTNATVRTNANPVAQQTQGVPIQAAQTNQLIPPPLPPAPLAPQPQTNGLANPQGSALQSAIAIENLNNTVWRGSGWKVANPYESLLKDARLAGMAQRQFGQNQSPFGNQMGGMGMMGNQMGSQFNGGFGQQQQQSGGNYGNPNANMGGYGNLFGAGGFNDFSQQMSPGMGGQSMGGYNAARGLMQGFSGGGYGGLNTPVSPYF